MLIQNSDYCIVYDFHELRTMFDLDIDLYKILEKKNNSTHVETELIIFYYKIIVVFVSNFFLVYIYRMGAI